MWSAKYVNKNFPSQQNKNQKFWTPNGIGGIFKEFTSKLANTRINEFLNAKSERDLKMQGKVVDADDMLRPKLKGPPVSSMAHCWLQPLCHICNLAGALEQPRQVLLTCIKK